MTSRLYIQLADNGNIRKWQSEPFEGGTEYVAASVLSPLPARGRDAMNGVKELEFSLEENGDLIAQSVIGWYYINLPYRTWNLTTPHGDVASFDTLDAAKSAAQADYERRILSALTDEARAALADEADEAYEIGKRDGYEKAVQEIDRRTGGDGEYRYCTDHDPDRHTPDAPVMIQRIADRFEVLNLLAEANADGRDQPDDHIPAATTEPDPVAYGEDIGGKIVSVRLDKSTHCIVPLYRRPEGAKPIKLIPHEIEVLEMLAGKRKGQWGAWVAVCLENMADAGLCTRGPNYRITDAGRVALASIEGKEG